MRFRPCIDIHNGKVKQIVGGSLCDEGDRAEENFVSQADAAFYAEFYKKDNLRGGHIILLNPETSPYYDATREQALRALAAWRGGLQIGGGIRDDNAAFWLEHGASHVIVTSFVFRDGRLHYENLEKMMRAVGKEHLVLDLSCRKRDGQYYIVTDRWQKFTDVILTEQVLDDLSGYCDEFLIHAVDAEGKARGIETELAGLLGSWAKIPVTYAGGVGSFADIEALGRLGRGKIDVTIGSALDLFGGTMAYREVLAFLEATHG
ncbi:1-(5-phosphoribosyl)-5-[(5-phosphoribosylamino)methylideneamino]imidazole-4-carboxamide isomerase [Marvinbryantia formatexigens DSM 14469]|uniref:1-(5-phosphoribosyl)-5-[(5-phosphoribosylamino)methylideneamino]imidazole-4-carboxamide isomerase n=1 Tax=Marvinbryantia formatexigens DSM 14469 TaxID=478749 RepID=C6LIX9_9FIRM|nr:phosphoribosylformimino-5-aminoimidazole carboxamide ribotide isomerase [Marvinbryantia formatexigens]EET59518.1 1-(5-phosphoribosyl)-5-[(5-phosphoribosylamino)methylideneamino]imidazole-4-carboxamide isomerase [Marvinbryantia formatexigens DSM 14469]UWO24007.1 phosphoribosylformimino-5-aminoimidazole carboxamide ribotide isomerase [Marvinbryantia formatexigens DSM 14469]SDG66841.1 1-(5-phosphoribosyl)-5-[(5-phosphoribosylamino)methylideneamino] imidazole-4-carboxamide isomerase [Marvinbryant